MPTVPAQFQVRPKWGPTMRGMTDETGGRLRAMVPAHVARLTDKVMNTYGAFVDHSVGCEDCKEVGWRCEKAEELWQEYKAAKKEARES